MSDADHTAPGPDADGPIDEERQSADDQRPAVPGAPREWFGAAGERADDPERGSGASADEVGEAGPGDRAADDDGADADADAWAFERRAQRGMPGLRSVTAPTDTHRSEQVAPPPVVERHYYAREAEPEGTGLNSARIDPGADHGGEPECHRASFGADAADRALPGRPDRDGGEGSGAEQGNRSSGIVGTDAQGVPIEESAGVGPDGSVRRRGGAPRFAPAPVAQYEGGTAAPGAVSRAPDQEWSHPPGPPPARPEQHAAGVAQSPLGHPPAHGPPGAAHYAGSSNGQGPPASPRPWQAPQHGQRSADAAAGAPGSAHVRFLPPTTEAQPAFHGQAHQPGPQQAGPPQHSETDITRGAHRTHWASVPFQVLLVAVVFLALPGTLLLQFGLVWVLLLTLAVACGAVAFALLTWWNSSFGLREDHLVVHSGLLRRSSREIPLSRLQAVDVVRPLLMQILGLAELRVELAGGDASEIRLRYLTWGRAEQLRATLLAHAAGLSGATPEAPEWPFYKLPFGLLLGALAFRLPVLGSVMLFLLLIAAGMAVFEPGVLGGAVPLLLGLMRGFLGPLMRYTDFYASLSPDGLRLRYGIFQARMQTVPPGRVQAVRIVEPLLWRALGVVRVEANVAGYVGERQMDSSTLLPVVPRRLGYLLVNQLFPGSDVSRAPAMHPAGSGHARDGVLGVDEQLFVTRRGLVCQVTEIVPHARTQSVRMSAGPLSRWRGMAVVEADTPPGPIRARAVGREVGESRRVVDGMAAYGHAARRSSAGPERWATRSEAAPSSR